MSPLPMIPRPAPASGLLAAALGLAIATAHAQAPAPAGKATPATPAAAADDSQHQLQLASRQYAEMQQMLALDTRCKWLEPIARTALEASAQERLAWFNAHGGEPGHPEAAARQAVAARAALACNSPEAQELAQAIRYGTWQMRVSWALRGEALLPGAGRPDWFKDKSTVAMHRAALEEAASGLEDTYGASIKRARKAVREEAEALLAVRCTASDKACPATTLDAGARAHADAWVKQAERYAAALSGTRDKVGAPPPAR